VAFPSTLQSPSSRIISLQSHTETEIVVLGSIIMALLPGCTYHSTTSSIHHYPFLLAPPSSRCLVFICTWIFCARTLCQDNSAFYPALHFPAALSFSTKLMTKMDSYDPSSNLWIDEKFEVCTVNMCMSKTNIWCCSG